MNAIKKFYDDLKFPGYYTMPGLDYHFPVIRNSYLRIIDNYLTNNMSVIDVGCGTGLITNLFAKKYPNSQFVGVDFANGIDYAAQFAKNHHITNTQFIKEDFLKYKPKIQYDLVICQGVLHHIPDYHTAAENLKLLLRPGGILLLGLYHPWGKLAKKIIKVDYKNEMLQQDQEHNPYEITFTLQQVRSLLFPLNLEKAYPSSINIMLCLNALINQRNGGLTVYVLEKSNH